MVPEPPGKERCVRCKRNGARVEASAACDCPRRVRNQLQRVFAQTNADEIRHITCASEQTRPVCPAMLRATFHPGFAHDHESRCRPGRPPPRTGSGSQRQGARALHAPAWQQGALRARILRRGVRCTFRNPLGADRRLAHRPGGLSPLREKLPPRRDNEDRPLGKRRPPQRRRTRQAGTGLLCRTGEMPATSRLS